jgi:hypothetical protein
MRGLLGDATEEFIERFDDKHQRPANDEETYKLANVMGECGGLDVLLERLSCVRDIQGEGRPLLGALVKLLSFCTKVQTNRSLLITPELNAVQRLLGALKLCLQVNFKLKMVTELILTWICFIFPGSAEHAPVHRTTIGSYGSHSVSSIGTKC